MGIFDISRFVIGQMVVKFTSLMFPGRGEPGRKDGGRR
jgi:hypothetical protein